MGIFLALGILTFAAQAPVCVGYDACIAAAITLVESGELGQAEHALLIALERQPHSYEPHFLLGIVKARRSDYPAALEHFDSALARNPGYAPAHIETGGTYYMMGSYEKAAQALEKAVALEPDDQYALDLLATSYYLQGDLLDAIDVWNKVGKPELDNVVLQGANETSDLLVSQAIQLNRYEVVTPRDLRSIRSRLRLYGVFTDVTFHLIPRQDSHRFDLLVVAPDTSGLGSFWANLGSSAITAVAHETVGLHFRNAFGRAWNLDVSYRWDETQQRLSVGTSLPTAPISHGFASLRLTHASEIWSFNRGKQPGGQKSGGPEHDGDFRLTFDTVRSTYSHPLPWGIEADLTLGYNSVARRGLVGPARGAVELPHRSHILAGTGLTRAFDTKCFPLVLRSSFSHFVPLSSGDVHARSLLLSIESVFAPDGAPARNSSTVLGVRFSYGYQDRSIPHNQAFVLGVGLDDNLALRGHPTTVDGVRGASPLATEFALLNVEAGRRLLTTSFVDLSGSVFVDTAQIFSSRNYLPGLYTDVGASLGVRFFKIMQLEYIFGYDTVDRSPNHFFRLSTR